MRSARSAAAQRDAGRSQGPGISVKLSALHPRYEPLQAARCVPALIATLTDLALAARQADIGLTVDAEEADRLEISLDVFAARAGRSAAGRLGRAGARGAGVPEARASVDRLDRGTGPAHATPHPDAAGEGRVLGHRDQAGAGAGPCRLSGVHPQGRDRCELARLRAAHAGARRCDLSGVRHAQRAQPGLSAGMCDGRLRDAAAARHGRGAVSRRDLAGACLCAGRHARGSARLSGAAAAGERRQHQLRASPGRSLGAGGCDRRRSGGEVACGCAPLQPSPLRGRGSSGSGGGA